MLFSPVVIGRSNYFGIGFLSVLTGCSNRPLVAIGVMVLNRLASQANEVILLGQARDKLSHSLKRGIKQISKGETNTV